MDLMVGCCFRWSMTYETFIMGRFLRIYRFLEASLIRMESLRHFLRRMRRPTTTAIFWLRLTSIDNISFKWTSSSRFSRAQGAQTAPKNNYPQSRIRCGSFWLLILSSCWIWFKSRIYTSTREKWTIPAQRGNRSVR